MSNEADRVAGELLACWFDPQNHPLWFKSTPAFDALLRDDFGAAVERAARGELDELEASADGALALCLLLDQIPRNIWRGTAAAFAQDEQARAVADRAITRGFDLAVRHEGRVFLYLPFEHSEHLADQDRAVKLIGPLGPEQLDYAVRHRDIVARFGRFPHRNRALGRTSTAEEEAFLQEPGSSF